MTPGDIAEVVRRHRRHGEDSVVVALADLVERHLETIERVESKVRPGGVLDRADLDAREAAREALRRAVCR